MGYIFYDELDSWAYESVGVDFKNRLSVEAKRTTFVKTRRSGCLQWELGQVGLDWACQNGVFNWVQSRYM